MAHDCTSLTAEDYFERKPLCCSDTEASSRGDKEHDDILEINAFDGLPYSSRYYKLLEERKELPVWKAKCEFMDTLAKTQFVVVSGSAKTGRSSQVSEENIVHFIHTSEDLSLLLANVETLLLSTYQGGGRHL